MFSFFIFSKDQTLFSKGHTVEFFEGPASKKQHPVASGEVHTRVLWDTLLDGIQTQFTVLMN